MEKEVIYFDKKTFDNLINNAVEACRRLNQKGDFEQISDPISLGKVLENPEEYINNKFDNDKEAVARLEKHFGCDSITSLTPEERSGALFERTLGEKYRYYSFAVKEITRGRNELALNVDTNQDLHDLFTSAVWLLEWNEKQEWHFDEQRFKNRCTHEEFNPQTIQAIRELKRIHAYRNSPDAPQWFKNLFKMLDDSDPNITLIDAEGLTKRCRLLFLQH